MMNHLGEFGSDWMINIALFTSIFIGGALPGKRRSPNVMNWPHMRWGRHN